MLSNKSVLILIVEAFDIDFDAKCLTQMNKGFLHIRFIFFIVFHKVPEWQVE